MKLQVLHPRTEVETTADDRIREDSPTDEIIAWVLHRFQRQRMILTTQFGMEGCALIDMCSRVGLHLTVGYLDTGFFFPETYELRDRLIERYPHLSFVNYGTSLSPEEQADQHGPELWKTNPDLCCKLRKVAPMQDLMHSADVWLTGLRRQQSKSRAELKVIEWDWKFLVLKVNPLSFWSREQVWQYVQANDVPFNPLHEQGYPSIGCTHCTTRVAGLSASEYSRDGRWNGHEKTECGLHGEGI